MSGTTFIGGFELVQYTTATKMAEAFDRARNRIHELRRELYAEVNALNAVYEEFHQSCELIRQQAEGQSYVPSSNNRQFSAEVYVCDACSEEQINREMKRVAWKTLIEKLGIRQYMSVKRKEEFDAAMRTPSKNQWGVIREIDKDLIDQLPEITAEGMVAVTQGMAASAGEYLRENVVEVYKALKPYRGDCLKTNAKNRWMLSDKVIVSWACEPCFRGQWRLRSGNHGELVRNLENVLRLLDGKGFRNTHCAEIEEAMRSSKVGKTAYFDFKCFRNGNLHLKFLRPDLIQQFNQLAGNSRQLRGRDDDEYLAGVAPDYSMDDPYKGGMDLFETPEELAAEMCLLAGIRTGSRVLEPSCGPGRIVQCAVNSGACVTAIDFQEATTWKLKQHPAVIAHDNQNFLAIKPETIGLFNAVVMNPPFSKGRDVKHIRHAWSFVARGGCLVAVASRGVVFRQDKLYRDFREWLQKFGGEIIDLPSASFRESGTDVETVLVVIRDPSAELVVGDDDV